jgi:DNA polymerase III epsilon subunit-like protein
MKSELTFPNRNYVVFDFETSGLDAVNDEVIEISAIKFVDGVKQTAFDCLLKPSKPISDTIISLTKITNEMLDKDGKYPEKVWKEFALYIQDLPLIGHNNISFDRLFLEEAFRKYNLAIPGTYRYIDTAMLYKGRKAELTQRWYESHFAYCKRVGEFRAPGIYYKLTLCCQEFGIDISTLQAHRAASDIEMTNRVYQKLLANVPIQTKQPSVADLKEKILQIRKKAQLNKMTDPNGQIRMGGGE